MPQTLLQKLRIKPGFRIAILNAPDAATGLTQQLTDDVVASRSLEGSFQQVHCFVQNRKELAALVPPALPALDPDGLLWVYFPKKTSAIQTDLSRDHGWEGLKRLGCAFVSLISLDETWSAFAFRRRGATSGKRKPAKVPRGDDRYINRVKRTVTLPPDAKRALSKSRKAAAMFETLSFTHRREYVEWILEAKEPETRARRIHDMIARLAKSLKNPWAKNAGVLLLLFTLTAPAGFAQSDHNTVRPVHTYSIVARDSVTGELGVAVQSHWFSVGSSVAWAEAGVGAVATQSFVDVSYGPLGLELMRSGKTAHQALAALLTADPGREVRQVAMVDSKGNTAVHTGSRCITDAGHKTGPGYSVQANLMLNDRVWGAMSKAFETASGPLAERMLAALEAAQSVGGDIRGKQSAAILVVKPTSSGRPWADRVMELRVEDHSEPVAELRRLVKLNRAYEHMNNGDLAVEHGDVDGALREYGAAEAMVPDNLEMKFWHAVALVNAGRLEKSLPIFREVFARDRNWATLVPRLPGPGLLTADEAAVKKILQQAPAR